MRRYLGLETMARLASNLPGARHVALLCLAAFLYFSRSTHEYLDRSGVPISFPGSGTVDARPGTRTRSWIRCTKPTFPSADRQGPKVPPVPRRFVRLRLQALNLLYALCRLRSGLASAKQVTRTLMLGGQRTGSRSWISSWRFWGPVTTSSKRKPSGSRIRRAPTFFHALSFLPLGVGP